MKPLPKAARGFREGHGGDHKPSTKKGTLLPVGNFVPLPQNAFTPPKKEKSSK